MAYIPGAGLKKPMNMLEGPIYPDIKKGPPRFQWTGKYWDVDGGRTMLETEHIPQFVEGTGAVLIQSRDYNKQFAYGVSSFRDAVNLEFRPPLITMEDNMPLSRIPRPIVVPRINPGTAHDSGTNAFSAQNNHPSEINAFLTDRVKDSEWRPTFFAPLEIPVDNSVLPDLETTLPPYSVSTEFAFPVLNGSPLEVPNFGKEYRQEDKLTILHNTGYDVPLHIDGRSGLEDAPLYYNRPQISASAGVNPNYDPGTTLVEHTLHYNRPQVSGSAGVNLNYDPGSTPVNYELDYNRPQVSGGAGIVEPFTMNGETRTDIYLDEKLMAGQDVNNAAPDIRASNYLNDSQPTKIEYRRPQYSYQVNPNIPFYNENERSAQNVRMVQQKKHAQAKYNGYVSRSAIPRSGIDTQRVRLRSGKSQTPMYRF